MAKQDSRHGAPPRGRPVVERGADFGKGLVLHQAGHLTEAERIYRALLGAQPKHFDAANLLGMIFLQRGQFVEAEQQFRRAIKINATIAAAHYNRGNALIELHRADEALDCFGQALAREPNNVEALNGCGVALLELGRGDDALASFDKALALNANFAAAHFNRGNALKALGRLEEAIVNYEQATARQPNFAEAFNNRGTALLKLGRSDDAAESFRQAIRIDPAFVEGHCNLAGAFLELRRFGDAIEASNKALQVNARSAAAWAVQGDALRNLRRFEAALTAYDKAIAFDPRRVDGWFGRARALNALRRHAEAAECYMKLLELDPDFEFAKGTLLYEKLLVCDWRGFAPLVAQIRADIAANKKAIEPFCFQAVTNSLAEARHCAEIFCASQFPEPTTKLWTGERYRNDKIRVGYLSGELHNHAVARLIVELFELHDKSRFELFAFDNGIDDDGDTRQRINRAFDQIIDISQLDGSRAAAAIKDYGIEILINLNGYYGRSRTEIFARRPAPIQVNYLGFSGTMGADFMDYIIGDHTIMPAGSEVFYREKIVYLPECFQPSDRNRVIGARENRAALGLPESGVVFCCFNNALKFNPHIFDVWMRLLAQVESSVLWLLFDTEKMVANLRREAAARGVAPERVVFSRRAERIEDYFARYRLADLFLDSFPFNAGATANDALWAGLPLLTCYGEVYTARMAGSLLGALGLQELITSSLADYEALILRLTREPALLAELKAKLQQNRASFPLFDTPRLTRYVEAAYATMWQRYQDGSPPKSFEVEPQLK